MNSSRINESRKNGLSIYQLLIADKELARNHLYSYHLN